MDGGTVFSFSAVLRPFLCTGHRETEFSISLAPKRCVNGAGDGTVAGLFVSCLRVWRGRGEILIAPSEKLSLPLDESEVQRNIVHYSYFLLYGTNSWINNFIVCNRKELERS